MPIAQLNIAHARYTLEDPPMAGFMDTLGRINALAERSAGFVWRYIDETGYAAGTKRDGAPSAPLNLSVRETPEHLEAYALGTVHAPLDARKDEGFETMQDARFIMWPLAKGHIPTVAKGHIPTVAKGHIPTVAKGHIPTVAEPLSRLDDTRRTGPTDRVFGWDALPNGKLWMEERCA